VLKEEEREKFRMFMRMVENFSGCRVLIIYKWGQVLHFDI